MPLEIKKTDLPGLTIGVWHITEKLEDLVERLHPEGEELQTFQSFKSVGRKLQWLSVRLMLKSLLGKTCKILYNTKGQPYLTDHDLQISISHSHGYSAIALSETSTPGVDVQLISEKVARIRHKFVHEEEHGIIDCAEDQNAAMTILWGAKESIFKCLGESNVFFKEDIRIVDFKVQEEGEFMACVSRPNRELEFNLSYQTIGRYILVYIRD